MSNNETTVKERVYDDQIEPLMSQILTVCQGAGISMIAGFDLSGPECDDLMCTSQLPDETGSMSPFLESRMFREHEVKPDPDRLKPGSIGAPIKPREQH